MKKVILILLFMFVIPVTADAVEIGLLLGKCQFESNYGNKVVDRLVDTYAKRESFCEQDTRPILQLYIAHRWHISDHWYGEARGDHYSYPDDEEFSGDQYIDSGNFEAITVGIVYVF